MKKILQLTTLIVISLFFVSCKFSRQLQKSETVKAIDSSKQGIYDLEKFKQDIKDSLSTKNTKTIEKTFYEPKLLPGAKEYIPFPVYTEKSTETAELLRLLLSSIDSSHDKGDTTKKGIDNTTEEKKQVKEEAKTQPIFWLALSGMLLGLLSFGGTIYSIKKR